MPTMLAAMSDETDEAGVDGCDFGSEKHGHIGVAGRTTRNARHPPGGDDSVRMPLQTRVPHQRWSFQNSHSGERLRLPLQVAEAVCECGDDLDREGRHRAACTRSGRMKTRALAPERTLARVCREAGATVRFNAKLGDMNLLSVAADDERAIEVLASGLPLFFGAQLAADVTLRCALTVDGRPQPGAAAVDGAVCSRAREDKERKYPELLAYDRCRLVVLALETGGRSEEAVQFMEKFGCVSGSRGTTHFATLCGTHMATKVDQDTLWIMHTGGSTQSSSCPGRC